MFHLFSYNENLFRQQSNLLLYIKQGLELGSFKPIRLKFFDQYMKDEIISYTVTLVYIKN